MKAVELSLNELKNILENGFYYYTRYGTIKHVRPAEIGDTYVKSSILHNVSFPISDLNKKWFIDKEACVCAASEYLNSLPVSIDIIKRITELTKEDKIWYKNDNGKVDCFGLDEYESFYYLPTEQRLECYYDYDNGLYCETRTEPFPLSEYGKTWALTKEDFR